MTGLAHRGWKLNDYDKTLVKYLKKHGYKAALVGEHHIAPNDQTDLIGYDEVNLLGNYQADAISAGASEWLRHNTEKYWFLSCGFWNTHRTSYPKVKPGAGKYSATFPIYPDRPLP